MQSHILDRRLFREIKDLAKKDLVALLSVEKEDCITHSTFGNNSQLEEEAELASNPSVRHTAPLLQVNSHNKVHYCYKVFLYGN
ncbi:hypothetical protein P5V15_008573 [Pogonomyrmex californicus]